MTGRSRLTNGQFANENRATTTRQCPVCGNMFSQGHDEGPKRFATRKCCSLSCSRTKTGLSRHPIYSVWNQMVRRCTDRHNPKFYMYGARGITVCERWLSFENFIEDMGMRPSKNHSIDRIDNNKGYSPENCRWATRKEQQNNMRSNRLLTVDGVTMNVSQWAAHLGVNAKVIDGRLRLGWSDVEAVKTPTKFGNRPHTRVSS